MTKEEVSKALDGLEYYDNSVLSLIQGCRRKGFYYRIGPLDVPLHMNVGDGAKFGTAVHAALESYHTNEGSLSESDRRGLAYRSFAAEHSKQFQIAQTGKYQLENGLIVLYDYFCKSQEQQNLYRSVKREFTAAIMIKPRDGEDFEPFYYVIKVDDLVRRIGQDWYAVREHKTVSSGVFDRIDRMYFDRQTRGYVWGVKQIYGYDVRGVIPNVILVAVVALECASDFVSISDHDLEEFRQQTINVVEWWRSLVHNGQIDGSWNLNRFDQNPEECFKYGRCGYYSLCRRGAFGPELADYKENVWTPFQDSSADAVIVCDENSRS